MYRTEHIEYYGIKNSAPIDTPRQDIDWDAPYERNGDVISDSAIEADGVNVRSDQDDTYGIVDSQVQAEMEPEPTDRLAYTGEPDLEELTTSENPENKKKRRDLLNYFHTGDENVLNKDQYTEEYRALQISVKEALRTRGVVGEQVILKELQQMLTKEVWTPVDGRKLTAEERSRVIRSSMGCSRRTSHTEGVTADAHQGSVDTSGR